MLSRTADDLFWLSRYVERAENIARLLEVADRMSLMPVQSGESNEWLSVLISGGVEPTYRERFERVTEDQTIAFMALDEENTSSIRNCFRTARENARAQRHTITRELWEALNDTWHEIRDMTAADLGADSRSSFFDWVKQRSHLVRGAIAGTMIRDDAYNFIRLGTFIERSDSTARILDVKYHLILPDAAPVGGAADYYQWAALLQSVSAHGSYRRLTGDAIKPWKVADLLILRPEMPRSIRSSYDEIMRNLSMLSSDYGCTIESVRIAGQLHGRLLYGQIDEIFQSGLHEFLTDVVDRNILLGRQIQKDFLLTVNGEAEAVETASESARQNQTMS